MAQITYVRAHKTAIDNDTTTTTGYRSLPQGPPPHQGRRELLLGDNWSKGRVGMKSIDVGV